MPSVIDRMKEAIQPADNKTAREVNAREKKEKVKRSTGGGTVVGVLETHKPSPEAVVYVKGRGKIKASNVNTKNGWLFMKVKTSNGYRALAYPSHRIKKVVKL